MPIKLKRIQESPEAADGYRVLVDRLWPRGISKEKADIDEWLKNVAPSDELRKWFHADESRWGEFRRLYMQELKEHRETLRPLVERSEKETVTLLFSARDEKHNNAVVLCQYLKLLRK